MFQKGRGIQLDIQIPELELAHHLMNSFLNFMFQRGRGIQCDILILELGIAHHLMDEQLSEFHVSEREEVSIETY